MGSVVVTQRETASGREPTGPFLSRADAGHRLVHDLEEYRGRDDLLVLALPRGGVPVAWEVARALNAPLDILIVRKLGVPGHEEMAMGAIASGGVRVLREDVIREVGITSDALAAVAADEQHELERRERAFRGDRAESHIEGRTVILVDDGLATGSTMAAAVASLRARSPGELVVAVPVAAAEACEELRDAADHVVCCITPQPFRAVSVWYEEFPQITDDEVRAILERAEEELPGLD